MTSLQMIMSAPHPALCRSPEELSAILKIRGGRLDEVSYPLLLLAMTVTESSAVLELTRNQLQKTIVFEAGSPVECRSNIATETLSRFLVSSGRLSVADERSALSAAAARGVPMEEILTERKLLSATELYRALQQNLGRKLLEPFSWTSGTFTISLDVPPLVSVLRVRVAQLLATGVMKVVPQESVDRAVPDAGAMYLTLRQSPLLSLEGTRLPSFFPALLESARRSAQVEEIRSRLSVDPEDFHRMLYLLLLTGSAELTTAPRPAHEFLELEESLPASTVLPAPSPAFLSDHPFLAPTQAVQPVEKDGDSLRGAARPPASETGLRPAASPDDVVAEFLSCRRRDAFELLGAAETDGIVPITRAYVAIAERFLPTRFDERAPDGLREKAQEVFLAAARAYAELADPTRRAALVKKRETLRQEAAATAEKGTAALLDPEALAKSARAYAAAGKLREALSSFELAADCDAQNGVYAAEAAWCRYQLRITPAAAAFKLVKNALRIDPNCGVAHLYAGQLQAAMGNRLEAEAYLSRAGSLMRGDPRPADAIKALR